MGEKRDNPKDSGMCFDSISLGELRKLMGRDGIGSLCREMMGRMMEKGKEGLPCLRFMSEMMTGQGKTQEEQKDGKEQNRTGSKKDGRDS